AINSMCDNVGKALADFDRMLDALAGGNLLQRISASYQGNFAQLKDNANKTADRIGATIAEIKASAREVTNASAEIATSTTDLSQRTEEQAASLEETSASMEQISATVRKNAENAQAANQSAGDTRIVAERGGQVVAQAVEAMAKIEESSAKISDIISVIDEIARQRNLLALNAGGSRTRRRSGSRLCGGGFRSAQPGAAFVAGCQGHQGTDHQLQWAGEGRRRSRQSRRRVAERDRGVDQESGRDRCRHRQCERRAGDRHRASWQGADPNGRGHTAKLGARRGERRNRQDAGEPGACCLLPD